MLLLTARLVPQPSLIHEEKRLYLGFFLLSIVSRHIMCQFHFTAASQASLMIKSIFSCVLKILRASCPSANF